MIDPGIPPIIPDHREIPGIRVGHHFMFSLKCNATLSFRNSIGTLRSNGHGNDELHWKWCSTTFAVDKIFGHVAISIVAVIHNELPTPYQSCDPCHQVFSSTIKFHEHEKEHQAFRILYGAYRVFICIFIRICRRD